MTIFLDMDGVVSDAHRAFCHSIGRDDLLDNWPAGEFQVYKAAGIPEKTMWGMVKVDGIGLWADMRPLPWAAELYTGLRKFGRVVFLTAPSLDPQCLAGKLQWLKRFTGMECFDEYIITPKKSLLAGPGRLIIDDLPENCEQFIEAGGKAIQFPAMWSGYSEKYIVSSGVVERVLKTVEKFSEVVL